MSGIYSAAQIAAAEESWQHWKSKGASDRLAAALLGNEDRETSFDPKARGDKKQAGGPAQDHQARRTAIIKGCGIDVWTAPHAQQLEGIYQEMSAPWSAYRHVWPALIAAASIVAANLILVRDYEQSANQASGIAKQNDKASYWYQYFSKENPPPPASAPSPPKPKNDEFETVEAGGEAPPVIAGPSVKSNAGEGGLPNLIWKPTPNYYRSAVKRRLIVIHDCQGGEEGSIQTFLSQHHPRVSAHAVLSVDGSRATQMVPWTYDAWHVTDFNAGSIGLEMPGFAAKGFPEAEWDEAARMTAYLAHHFNIPIAWAKTGEPGERAGICRHYDLGREGGGHTDPCTTDTPWLRFMGLVRDAAQVGGWPASWGHD